MLGCILGYNLHIELLEDDASRQRANRNGDCNCHQDVKSEILNSKLSITFANLCSQPSGQMHTHKDCL